MSKFYYDWFMMCYNNEPPTVTESQLQTAENRGMITPEEHQMILDSKAEEEETVPPPEEPPAT
jgi:hypothetical protein